MMKNRIDSFLIKESISIKEAMRQMSKVGEKILFIVDRQRRLKGSLSDGDIRRWVLKGGHLSENIRGVYSKDPISVKRNYKMEGVKQLMLNKKIEWIPVIDEDKKIRDVLLWGNVFVNRKSPIKKKITLPVIIMAGGKGTRLDPFTKILPKPLIPIGDKTIIEMIMEKFIKYGIREFTLSINHKAKMIKAFFEDNKPMFKIHYIEEKKPLGTAGCLHRLKGKVKESIIVSNCDILIDADYAEMVEYHNEGNYDITIVGSFRHFQIPYGICEIENGGTLVDIHEKPEYDYLVNTGMYLLKKNVLKYIPKNEHYDITDLIKRVKSEDGKVGVFPIDEKSWIDIGHWDKYHEAARFLEGR